MGGGGPVWWAGTRGASQARRAGTKYFWCGGGGASLPTQELTDWSLYNIIPHKRLSPCQTFSGSLDADSIYMALNKTCPRIHFHTGNNETPITLSGITVYGANAKFSTSETKRITVKWILHRWADELLNTILVGLFQCILNWWGNKRPRTYKKSHICLTCLVFSKKSDQIKFVLFWCKNIICTWLMFNTVVHLSSGLAYERLFQIFYKCLSFSWLFFQNAVKSILSFKSHYIIDIIQHKGENKTCRNPVNIA